MFLTRARHTVARFLNTSGWEPLVYWKNGILMVRSAGKQCDVWTSFFKIQLEFN